MPTIKVMANWTVRATARITVTNQEYARLKDDPELVIEELVDDESAIEWKDEEWQNRSIFAVKDEDGNAILEPV